MTLDTYLEWGGGRVTYLCEMRPNVSEAGDADNFELVRVISAMAKLPLF